ncbi:hypothetical protein [Chondrinema litorale]|uniref:hypothetical protein n=1 Tax=Chondrinema litorale TaxID=2994555 RepID=UPI002542B239|nr:hypothetical protein [Chondrinema litorale]UZR96138.1 hypothetical protein OQ292_10000 [Chondrinema litorale]
MHQKYQLEKSLWIEKDYEQMGWHDALIYAFSLQSNSDEGISEILFDIDYIFKWVNPISPNQHFSFFISPCTLVFRDAVNLKIDIDTENFFPLELEVSDLILEKELDFKNGHKAYEWNLSTQVGDIKFQASGFEQYVRKLPKYTQIQQLTMEERGGVSFEKLNVNIEND